MPKSGRVLVIDDELDMLENCARLLSHLGYLVVTEADSTNAPTMFERERPDLVLTDLRMPGLDGLGVLRAIRAIDPSATVILITAFATIETAVEAVKEGAFDYLPKPFSGDQLRVCIERALEQRRLREENRRLLEQLTETYRFDKIIGRSLPMLQVFETIKKVAKSEANILIVGETGTGKELIARSLHVNSRRTSKPFIPVDCASLPENLLESELFGHEKGAFTGAQATRPGLFEFASGGTIFLDEVGDIGMNLQAKLLRVLQEREVRRVGSNRTIEVDVRVISATNHDLDVQMKAGRFREDLYYRLNVVSLALPPLAERREDVILLATHYLKDTAARYAKDVLVFAPEALELLVAAPWPGNVRQLVNVIEQVVALCASGVVPASLVQQALKDEPTPLASLEEARGAFEREYLVRILRMTGGNVTHAAKLAQRNRTEFYKLLERHRLESKMFKPEKG